MLLNDIVHYAHCTEYVLVLGTKGTHLSSAFSSVKSQIDNQFCFLASTEIGGNME